jgi:hypothetical protein
MKLESRSCQWLSEWSCLLRRSNIGVEVNTYAYSDITKVCSNTQYTAIACHTRYTDTDLDYRRTYLFV